MTQLPMRRELQTLVKPAGRQIGAAETAWYRLVATITDPDLIMVVAFCAIGLLITVNVILRFPDFGLTLEQLELFP